MSKPTLELRPFAELPHSLRVFGSAERIGNRLALGFQLEDPGKVVLDSPRPDHAKVWPRADDLWKTTCFECFLAVPGAPVYWEINLSPGSHRWALYRFENYRTPQPPKSSEDLEMESIEVSASSLKCELRIPARLDKLQATLTAVLKTSLGVSYFALQHRPEKPDFHWREGFILDLSPPN